MMVVAAKVRIVRRNDYSQFNLHLTLDVDYTPIGVLFLHLRPALTFISMSITLYIVRHAKAEDRAIFMADHDRQLTSDGIIAAARMGHYLHEKGIRPDIIISSTAPRAKDTARGIAEKTGYEPEQIRLDETLFDGGPKAYLAAINAVPESAQTAMIVGHNPDVTYLAEYLTHQQIGSMSKGAVIAVTFDNLTWAEVSGRTGHVTLDIKPRQLSTNDEL
jgi:phosphohistidine phosphatase